MGGTEPLVGSGLGLDRAGELDQRGGHVSARVEFGGREAVCKYQPDPLDAVAAADVT